MVNSKNSFKLLLMMILAGDIVLSEEQSTMIANTIMKNALSPFASIESPDVNDDVHLAYGIRGLADILHCSIPTAQKWRNDGRFDAAMYKFGKKLAWDRNKVLEIVKAQK